MFFPFLVQHEKPSVFERCTMHVKKEAKFNKFKIKCCAVLQKQFKVALVVSQARDL